VLDRGRFRTQRKGWRVDVLFGLAPTGEGKEKDLNLGKKGSHSRLMKGNVDDEKENPAASSLSKNQENAASCDTPKRRIHAGRPEREVSRRKNGTETESPGSVCMLIRGNLAREKRAGEQSLPSNTKKKNPALAEGTLESAI